MVEVESVLNELTAPQHLTKGQRLGDLYQAAAAWTGIAVDDVEIAQIAGPRSLSGHRRRRPFSEKEVVRFSDRDRNTKLKRVPIEEGAELVVWDKTEGDLLAKEVERRRQCTQFCVSIHDRIVGAEAAKSAETEPPSIWTRVVRLMAVPAEWTLSDLSRALRADAVLSAEQRHRIEGEGRFRSMESECILKSMTERKGKAAPKRRGKSATIDTLRFEAERAPTASELVVWCRLKTKDVNPKTMAVEHECYVSAEDTVSSLKALLAAALSVDANKFQIRRARKDWTLGAVLEAKPQGTVRDVVSENAAKLILNESLDPKRRSIAIYCQLRRGPNGRRSFDIPKAFRPRGGGGDDVDAVDAKDIDGDVAMNGDGDGGDGAVPEDDGLDVYASSSALLCSVTVRRESDGAAIKRAMTAELVSAGVLVEGVDALCCRLSLHWTANGLARWQIMNKRWKVGVKKGRCIVEWFESPRSDAEYDNGWAKGDTLCFVHKLVPPPTGWALGGKDGGYPAARYGSRFEVELDAPAQLKKLETLKKRVLAECGWTESMSPEHMVLAARHSVTHRWTVLAEEAVGKRKTIQISHKIFDRQIIAVVDTQTMTPSQRKEITPRLFETEWDRHCQRRYDLEQQHKDEEEELDDDLIGGIKINFNDSQSDSENRKEDQ